MKIASLLFLISISNAFGQVKNGLFRDIPLDKELYAFGESAHGNAAEYQLKLSLIHELALNNDSVIVYIEMPFDSELYIDSFFQKKISKEYLVTKFKFYYHRTNSFVHFLEELRKLNKIKVRSIDMQHWKSAFAFLEKNFKLFRDDSSMLKLSLIEEFIKNPKSFNQGKQDLKLTFEGIRTDIEESDTIIDRKRSLYAARILEQFVFDLESPLQNKDLYYRDSCMASNVMFWSKSFQSTGVVISANAHLLKFEGLIFNMGYYLNKEIEKGKLYVFCSQFLEGTILSRSYVNNTYINTVQTVPIFKKSVSFKISKRVNDQSEELVIPNDSECFAKLFKKKLFIQDFGAGDTNSLRNNYRQLRLLPICDAVIYHRKSYASIEPQ